ncbi:hypothetical protein LTR50_000581 [Elasticomyces elasticus]|nr:hypothetical protein LTR50_000459 [Elasticomyces elasticus]KAK4993356.1 hypothetical protein LTR50_000581 [Elasticomyces elasticus]
MSLARAFTTRRKRPEGIATSGFLSRTFSQKSPAPSPSIRHKISSPVALISTTNVLSYNAPDIVGTSPIESRNGFFSSSSVSSHSSADDSDASSTSEHSRDTVTDASSIDESPTLEPNHLSCYFKPSVETSGLLSRSNSVLSTGRPSFDSGAPIVPQRAASHSKKAHEVLSRKRSIQRIAAPPTSAREMSWPSAESLSGGAAAAVVDVAAHPFGKELEQLNEIAEEFGSAVRDAEADADRSCIEARDLAVYGANEYVTEIGALLEKVFDGDSPFAAEAGWI